MAFALALPVCRRNGASLRKPSNVRLRPVVRRRARVPIPSPQVRPVTMVAGGAGPGGGGEGAIELNAPAERERRDVGRLLKLFGRLALPYLRRERQAKIDAGLVLASTLANNAINVFISYTSRDYWTALNSKDVDMFYHQTAVFFAVLCVCVPVLTLGQWIREMTALRWRNWMTDKVMSGYLTNRSYYAIDQDGSLDNPDQRLSVDLNAFTSESLSFVLSILKSVIDVFSFSAILFTIYPPLFFVLIGYAATGTVATAFVGKSFVALNRRQLVREADFRYSLIRLRENAESVAFFKGESRELRALSGRLGRVIDNATELIGWQRNLGFLQSGYRYAVQVLPALVVSPRYFSGAIELGSVTQAFGAFSHVFQDLSLVVTRFDALSQLGAQLGRVQELCDAVETNLAEEDRLFSASATPESASHTLESDLVESRIAVCESADGSLSLDRVSVSTPSITNPRELVYDVSLKVERGGRLLVAGPSGTGKSSLIRAIAGLWTVGSGVVTRPADVFFLPQRPFCTLGNLRENLIYPKSIEDDDVPSDAELLRFLDIVDLHNLPLRMEGGLSAMCDWGDTLSLGEQQRLSFARLLISKPSLAVIDEGSSALDLDSEKRYVSCATSVPLARLCEWQCWEWQCCV